MTRHVAAAPRDEPTPRVDSLRRVEVFLRRIGWISGVCVDPEEKPLPGVGIRVQTAGGELAGVTGWADRDGRFRLMCA